MSTRADEVDTEPDDFRDLTEAAAATLDFWDNPPDDEDWNRQS